ncbi:substrate-binding domain-containing protein [Streptomyces sp. GD-15H]|uniref:substrate-binding domain-containing protein n=1 Tax=Streptomyces sp. GD-15H TaxID=3129112 RepID=UPI00324720A2
MLSAPLPPRCLTPVTESAFHPVAPRTAGWSRHPWPAAAAAVRNPWAPKDVSVIGFDDLPGVRRLAPPLSTVRQPLSEMAATAPRLLLRIMDGHHPESTRTELSTHLVERANAAPPRG